MAYKQNNNPFKKLHQDLQGFGQRHSAWKQKRKEASIGNDGLTSMERRRAEKKTRKPGESKFQADVRRRKESRKQPVSKKNQFTNLPDPKSEINVKGANTPSWNYKTKHQLGYNPDDLRQNTWKTLTLPSAPGDPYTYYVTFGEDGEEHLSAWNNETEEEVYKLDIEDSSFAGVNPYSDKDKATARINERAIRKRYTGSETGDFKNWAKHNTWTGGEMEIPPTEVNPDAWKWPGFAKGKSYAEYRAEVSGRTQRYEETYEADYLPYDLAQKTHNPKYKGSKK